MITASRCEADAGIKFAVQARQRRFFYGGAGVAGERRTGAGVFDNWCRPPQRNPASEQSCVGVSGEHLISK